MIRIWTRKDNKWTKWPDYPQNDTLQALQVDFIHAFGVVGTFSYLALGNQVVENIDFNKPLVELRNKTFAFNEDGGGLLKVLVRIV